jgi:hypothetical protein
MLVRLLSENNEMHILDVRSTNAPPGLARRHNYM